MARRFTLEHPREVDADEQPRDRRCCRRSTRCRPASTRTSSRPRRSTTGRSTRAPYALGEDGDRRVARDGRTCSDGHGVARRTAVGLELFRAVEAPLDPREEAGPGPVVSSVWPSKLGLERPRHADAVLVHREALVRLRRRGTVARPGGSTRRPRTPAGGRARAWKTSCQSSTQSTTARRLGERCAARMRGSVEYRLTPERHHTDGGQVREAVEDADHRVVEYVAVVDARADHDLAVHLDAVVEQRAQPAQARGAAAVAKHRPSAPRDRWRGCHVERTESLGDDPLEIGLREAGEGGEVPVEEATAGSRRP